MKDYKIIKVNLLDDDPVRFEQSERFVYFIKCNSFVKIGYAVNAKCRLHDIQVCSPYKCKLLGSLRCDSKGTAVNFEKSLHKKFSHIRKRGEWFMYNDEIKEFIRKWCV